MEPSPESVVDWPGRRLGMPQDGTGSIARPGRRLGALALDWGLAVLVAMGFFAYDPTATLAIFAMAQIVFLLTISASVGHLVFGVRVIRLDGRPLGVWRPLVRTALICLVIPAVVWDRDQRGMHDRLIGTVLVRTRG